ncbi:DUF4157 domain-containing protein [Streptomyces sp. NPDC048669]|uniref:eCIS core domain-containing protein n=1 Tax=Streptomyces sp. NPDC048669 TaxID=3155267 RepID=UPI003445B2CA
MHANSSTRGNEAENSQSSARTPPGRAATPLPALLALQGSAGNAAVVQMLRRAGQPWPQEEHGHSADCGHQQAEQPVQRSTVPDVLRSPGRPLDDNTRTEMEARLGADFSQVQVHSDAAARRSAGEIGARAYTSGNDVVLGEGGTDPHTLAHELVHVVQQRRGPVDGTDNGAGLSVSHPSDRFEREAEQMARTALAQPAPDQGHPATDASRTAPAQPGAAPVQRALATQITASSKEGEEGAVGDVIFAGRPDSAHSGTMGDHATAYVVLREAVRKRIRGKSAAAAGEEVYQLFVQAQQLPEAKLVGEDEQWKKNKDLMSEASTELKRLDALRTSDSDENWGMSGLQQMINAYLQYREALPLSTFFTKGNKGSGKGHGEAKAHKALLGYPDNNLSKEVLQASIFGLLDTRAVRHHMGQQEEDGKGNIPGSVAERHVESIGEAYGEGVITGAWGSVRAAVKAITIKLGKEEGADKSAPSMGKDSAISGKDAEVDRQPRLAVQIVTKDDGKIDRLLSSGRPETQFASTEGEGGHTIAWTVHIDYVGARLKGKTVTQAIGELDSLTSHVDDLKEGLNRTARQDTGLEDDFANLRVGTRRSGRLASKPAKSAAPEKDGEELQAEDAAVEEELDRKTEAAQKHMTDKVKAAKGEEAVPELALQEAVSAVLARINLIPGAASLYLSTSGAAEGIHRGSLKADKHTQEESRKAIFGMLQILPDHENKPAATALMEQHLKIVEVAYPEAFEASKLRGQSLKGQRGVLKEYWNTKNTGDDADFED